MKRRPMTAEEVSDTHAYRWRCDTGCDVPEALEHDTYNDAKNRAIRHCDRTGHTVHVIREHRHVMEIREIPT